MKNSFLKFLKIYSNPKDFFNNTAGVVGVLLPRGTRGGRGPTTPSMWGAHHVIGPAHGHHYEVRVMWRTYYMILVQYYPWSILVSYTLVMFIMGPPFFITSLVSRDYISFMSSCFYSL